MTWPQFGVVWSHCLLPSNQLINFWAITTLDLDLNAELGNVENIQTQKTHDKNVNIPSQKEPVIPEMFLSNKNAVLRQFSVPDFESLIIQELIGISNYTWIYMTL